MSLSAFDRDPYLRHLEVSVLSVGEVEGRPYALLDDTILYPEGGGQPWDLGHLGGVAVLEVRKSEEGIRHILASPVRPGPAHLELDWVRRFDHMQQHTAQHLLTAVAQDRFGWATTAFHLGTDTCDIELDVPNLSLEQRHELEETVVSEIRAARPVRSYRVDASDYAALKVRSRGLPEGHVGDIRLVEIEGLDLNTCGGTHLRSTAELENLALLGTESIRGGTRLFFVAGGRVRRRLDQHEQRNGALRVLLGVPDEGILASVEARMAQLQAAERRIRNLEEEGALALGASLAARPGNLLETHLEGRDLAQLQRVARLVLDQDTGSQGDRLLFLTAQSPEGASFVLASTASWAAQLPAWGREVAALLEGRGGGSKGFFQGKAGSLLRREEVLALLASHLEPLKG